MRAATSGLVSSSERLIRSSDEAGGEDPLDDVVVQVPGDAVPVGLDLQPPLPLPGRGPARATTEAWAANADSRLEVVGG